MRGGDKKRLGEYVGGFYELTLFPSLSMSALEHYNHIFDLLDSDKFYNCTKVDTSNKSTLVMTSP